MLATISALQITVPLSIHGISEVVQGEGGGREGEVVMEMRCPGSRCAGLTLQGASL